MNMVTLGNTGLKVSAISFGGIPIQRSDAANTMAVVDELEKYGINYMDTARGYTVSEEYLGNALKGRRERFILATKSMARSYEAMARDIDISLDNLQTDYIDVYQIHNLPLKDFDQVFGPDGAYRALAEAKAAGKIGHIGATAHSLDALRLLVEEHAHPIETVMFPYNIVEMQGQEVLALAREKGIGTIAMKPMAGGNLDDWNLALRFIAASGVMDVSIPGMGSVEEVQRNDQVGKKIVSGSSFTDAVITDMQIQDYVQQVTTADGSIVNALDPSKKDLVFTIETTVPEGTAAPTIGTQEIRAGRTMIVKTDDFETTGNIDMVDIADSAE